MSQWKTTDFERLARDEFGTSARLMGRLALGARLTQPDYLIYPKTVDEWAGCYKVLRWTGIRLESMRGFSKVWDELVMRWDTLSAFYERGNWAGLEDSLQHIDGMFRQNGCLSVYDIIYKTNLEAKK